MKRILTIFTLILGSCHPAFAEGAKAYLYNKPVLCASTEQEAIDMMQQIKEDGMKPLMYWRGNSFNGDETKFLSNFFLLYDPNDEQLTVVEQQVSGFTCIVTGGTGEVNFDHNEIKHLLRFWSDK